MLKGKVVFCGNFWEYFFTSLGLLVLSICTIGLLLPYWMYWSFKYFFTKLEIHFDNVSPNQDISKIVR